MERKKLILKKRNKVKMITAENKRSRAYAEINLSA